MNRNAVTVTIVLDHDLARCLGSNASGNFAADHADRFEVLALDGHEGVNSNDVEPLTTGPFVGGTLTWCGSLADALLLRAYEQSCGMQTALLCDLVMMETRLPAGGYADSYVVASSRQFADCWRGTCLCC
jgi:hypothetical protein